MTSDLLLPASFTCFFHSQLCLLNRAITFCPNKLFSEINSEVCLLLYLNLHVFQISMNHKQLKINDTTIKLSLKSDEQADNRVKGKKAH